MSCIRPSFRWRTLSLLAVLGSIVVAAGCSSNTNRRINPGVGVDTGVTLGTATGSTQLQQGATLQVSAIVGSDTGHAGVTWSLAGPGSLTGQGTTSVTYVGPAAGVIGTISAVLTATSVADTTKTAAVTLVTLGAPAFRPATETLFPANLNSPYGAGFTVAGGQGNFTWSTSGTLPPGMTLQSATGAQNSVSGTPTAIGTYTFTIQAVDAQSRSTSVVVTLLVNAASACTLQGTYGFFYSGFTAGANATEAGSFTVASDGSVTGVRDYKDAHSTAVADAISGTCAPISSNSGTLVLKSKSGSVITTQFNYAANTPDTTGTVVKGRLQLVAQGDDSGTGEFARQDSTAFNASALAGNFAFGLLGVDAANTALHFGLAGRLTLDTNGIVSAGLIDGNDASTPLTDSSLTGTFTAPDPATGRGTASLTAGGQNLALAYYVIGANRLLVIDNDTSASAPRMSGYMTRQQGTFDNTALANPGVLSLFGSIGNTDPSAVMALGRLSNANAAAGTVDVALDIANQQTNSSQNTYVGSSYAVDTTGRATLAFGAGSTRRFVMYLDGLANGYVVEQNSSAGSAGLLETQAATGLSNSACGLLVSGTQFPQAPGPMVLLPSLNLADGALSSTYGSGSFAINAATGYGLGNFTQTGLATQGSASIYMVQPADITCKGAKLRMLRFGSRASDASLEWINE